MSIRLMSEVWSDSYFKRADKTKLLVALALADFSNDEGLSWPSIDTLAKKARTSLRGAQEACREMEIDGVLKITMNGGRSGTNLYQITPTGATNKNLDSCELCNVDIAHTSLVRHHKTPRSKGGTDVDSNISWLCGVCHIAVHAGPGRLSKTGQLLRDGDILGAKKALSKPRIKPAVDCAPPRNEPAEKVPEIAAEKTALERTQTIRNHQEPSGIPKTPSAHAEFVKLWCDEYPKHHDGEKYVFQGKDAAAVKVLLETSHKTPQDLLKMAVAAWRNRTGFWCKSTASICFFNSNFNHIRNELNGSKPPGIRENIIPNIIRDDS